MKFILTRILIILTFLFSLGANSQNTITTNDLKLISGKWKGTLTYIDYKTNKPFTMPADLLVEQGKNEYQVRLLIKYPKEPNANSREIIKISKNGSLVNKNKVISRKLLANEEVQITTEYLGKDNNKKALIRTIYLFGQERFIIRKEVKFNDSEGWLMRNEYNFIK